MADSLYELLTPYLSSATDKSSDVVNRYLTRLTTLPLSALSTTEPQSLQQSSHTNLLSIQALSSRAYKSVTTSSVNLSTLRESLPAIESSASSLRDTIPELDSRALQFSQTYSRNKDENDVLERRKKSMLLSRNTDRLADILELPTLLSTAISSAGAGSSTGANYSQALDLFAHIKRLQILYPESVLIKSVLGEAELAMKAMTTNLIKNLRGQNIRLAAAIRTIGWLRRVAPELSQAPASTAGSGSALPVMAASEEWLFGSLFLTARLANLLFMLEALAPLRELADQETARRVSQKQRTSPEAAKGSATPGYASQGQQTERYLKRYIEIFREQSFATVSIFRNIFPAAEPSETPLSSLLPLPSALASFPLHLVEILLSTLKAYLPNITDTAARESLLMQVLYAANSLGRLGADFSMIIALLDEDEKEAEGPAEELETNGETEDTIDEDEAAEVPQWVRVMEKHRVQSARLEALAAGHDGVAGGRSPDEIKVR